YYGFLFGLVPERLVSPSNMLFMLPLGVAIFGLGRLTGADETASLFAALGLLTVPMVAFGSIIAEAGIGGVAFLAMSIYYAMAPDRDRLHYRMLSGLSAGLAFGFKLFHVVTIAVLAALIVVEHVMFRPAVGGNGRRRGFHTAAIGVLVFLASAFATSG